MNRQTDLLNFGSEPVKEIRRRGWGFGGLKVLAILVVGFWCGDVALILPCHELNSEPHRIGLEIFLIHIFFDQEIVVFWIGFPLILHPSGDGDDGDGGGDDGGDGDDDRDDDGEDDDGLMVTLLLYYVIFLSLRRSH